MGLFEKLFGTRSERELKKIQPLVDKILALESEYTALSEAELKGKTAIFKERLSRGETLEDLLPEAFAAIREAAWRVLGMKPYPVQLIGGIVLHQGRIAEMKTGEGKTLVAILPCYLNALTGEGVHVVTVNDYLAKRDSEWMGKVHRYMGLSVGLVIPGMTSAQRREAYAADITYCTNNELGFDYLRDNMALYKSELVQRGHAFAIVDEVDSILIDEARTPRSSPARERILPSCTRWRTISFPHCASRSLPRPMRRKSRTITIATTLWTKRPKPSALLPPASPRPKSSSAWKTWRMWKTPHCPTISTRL